MDVHKLSEVSSPNLEERTRSFGVEPDSTFSIYFIRLHALLDDVRAVERTENTNFGHLMDCVRLSEADQYPSKIDESYPDESLIV